jgi:SagB-type dehydrogenase family enzyme
MTDWAGAAARRYHELTKHSFESVRRGARFLDWDNRPIPFKEYAGIVPVALPRELPQPPVPALAALAAPPGPPAGTPGPADLARLLRWGAGVVRTRTVGPGGVHHFRSYASAGALYPVEVYLACADLPGIGAGLYHFHPLELALRPLRARDVRAALAAAADAPELAEAAAVLVLTGILWRSAWKYEARAYRHLYWDAGTMLANLLALAASAGLGPRLLTGFVDAEVNRLVGVDGEREAALALLAVGRGEVAPAGPPAGPIAPEVRPLSAQEIRYPEASALHAASSLAGVEDVRRYRGREAVAPAPVASGPSAPDPLEAVIARRHSVRDFTLGPVPASTAASLLALATAPIPSDAPTLVGLELIANALSGLEPGAYHFLPPDRFEPLRRGDFRAEAGCLCLGQPLGARAAATVFLMTDLEAALGALGARGYRAAQLESGICAGRIYLGATAQDLGATGLTFYDDEVSAFFAVGTSPMLCVALGRERRPAPGDQPGWLSATERRSRRGG